MKGLKILCWVFAALAVICLIISFLACPYNYYEFSMPQLWRINALIMVLGIVLILIFFRAAKKLKEQIELDHLINS